MLYKRGKKWWIRFSIRGREIRVTSNTDRKTLAEEFERRLREQIWRENELGDIQHTWEEATERWEIEKAHKRSLRRDKDAFLTAKTTLGGIVLSDIDGPMLQTVADGMAIKRKSATVNRLMASITGVLNAAVKWGWLGKAPAFESRYVEKTPPRWLSFEQFDTLCKELPPHAAAMARFAVAVGPRSGNLFRLKWEAIDLVRRTFYVDSGEFKGKRSVGFPLSADAAKVLEAQKGQHPVYAFPDHRGRAPVRSIKTCWRKACERAGVAGLRFHDLRHTFAAWHKLAGTPAHAIKELGGWSDLRMVDRYGHINPLEYAQYADNRRTINGTNKKPTKRKRSRNRGSKK